MLILTLKEKKLTQKKIIFKSLRINYIIDKLNDFFYSFHFTTFSFRFHSLFKKLFISIFKYLIIMILCLDYNKDVTLEILLKYLFDSNNIINMKVSAYEVDASEANTEQIDEVIHLLNKFKIHIVTSFEEKIIFEILKNLNKLIQLNYEGSASKYLCKQMHYSYGYLSSIFQKVLHFTISDYISFVKIIKAIKMFYNQNKTLTEIAYELNYSSVAHLSKQFKKITGLTFTHYNLIIAQRLNNSESC